MSTCIYSMKEKKKLCNTENQRPQGPQWHQAKKTRFQETDWKQFSSKSSKSVRGLLSKCTTKNFEVLQYNVQTTLYHPHPDSTKKKFNPCQKFFLKSDEKLIKLGINFGLFRPTVKQCVFQQLLQIILRNKLQAN